MYAMEVKTVLNLEADTRGLCQDSVTNTQEVKKGDHQENLDAILLDRRKETACSDRSLDRFRSCGSVDWWIHASSLNPFS